MKNGFKTTIRGKLKVLMGFLRQQYLTGIYLAVKKIKYPLEGD
jgi:hypothetical protein